MLHLPTLNFVIWLHVRLPSDLAPQGQEPCVGVVSPWPYTVFDSCMFVEVGVELDCQWANFVDLEMLRSLVPSHLVLPAVTQRGRLWLPLLSHPHVGSCSLPPWHSRRVNIQTEDVDWFRARVYCKQLTQWKVGRQSGV